MKAYKKNYLKHFNYCDQDYIPSELSGLPAVDIHHIKYGRFKRDDSINNLIALTREEHNQAHGIIKKDEKKLSADYLQRKHNEFIARTNKTTP